MREDIYTLTKFLNYPWLNTNKKIIDFMQKFNQRITLKKGELFIKYGQELTAVYGVEEGLLGIRFLTLNGKQRTQVIIGPGGATSVIDVIMRITCSPYEAYAYEDTTIIYITKEQALEGIIGDPTLSLAFMESLGDIVFTLLERLEILSSYCPKQRLILFLRNLNDPFQVEENGWYRAKYKFTHQDIADIIGTTREYVTLHLNDLKKKGLIKVMEHYIYFCKDFKTLIRPELYFE
ncbi:Crp/Fnr family transcriptional regulator [Dehalobacter sp.]|uniref:Crp/Fnr family transcriptional regulator n=1 Tax=Dehalobacter sp. TaxID=1962289 RepID=UPI00258971ED|nr:Crp/Fnr family transcriptional regulator [Dehalobacter sp.]